MKKTALYLLLTCSMFFPVLKAQQESRSSRVYANHLINPGCYLQTYDDKYGSGSWITGFSNYSNNVVIELGLDEHKHLAHTSALKICAKFDVELTSAVHGVTTLNNQQLDITYDPAELTRYKDKAQIIFPEVYQAKLYNIHITYCASSVSCSSCILPYTSSDAYLQAEISTRRTYAFGFASTFTTGDITHTVTGNDQAVISWPYAEGATEYELEYSFIDNYTSTLTVPASSNTLSYDLEHDATRIITTSNSYSIPLTYERGYLVYRLRAVGTNTLMQRIEGAWFPALAAGSLSNTSCFIPITPVFPSRLLNWTSDKTFAEQGKTGVGVSFSDALGMTRQTLARLNHESKTIAQSTLFDFYGRPAIELLPSPVSDLGFTYRFGLNVFSQSSTNVIFDKFIFENCNSNNYCSPASFTLNPLLSGGAARYYSPQNPNKEGYQGFLPDAEALPYTQIKYTDDGLNNIARQTLPGKVHQLGSLKEISYSYASPEQVELDRIFGSDAGRQEYYYRTSVKDPNGQISMSYQNVHGQTVATCLKGLNPTNVDPLSSLTPTALLQASYHEAPGNYSDPAGRYLEVDKDIEIFGPGTENYFYEVSWGVPYLDCNFSCYHAVYDVTLSLTDECGVELFDHDGDGGVATPAGFKGIIGRQPPYTSTISCNQPVSAILTGTNLSSAVTLTFTHPGKYKLHKKIRVSDLPLADYTKHFLATANCLQDKCSFFESYLNATDFSGCLPMTCTTCIAAVNDYSNSVSTNTLQSFPNRGYSNGGIEPSAPQGSTIPVYTESMTPQEVSEAYEQCSAHCEKTDRCAVYDKLMESDFYPDGLFAATSTISPNWPYSVFNPTNTLSPLHPVWSNSLLTYYNAAGQPDYVQINGINKNPYELTQDEFILYFRKSWAKTLVQFHPENCKKEFYCVILGNSIDYDDNLRTLGHFDKACGEGYLFPLRYSPYSSYSPSTCSTATPGIDPVVNLISAQPAFSTAIINFTTNIRQNFRGTGMDLYKFVAFQSNTAIAVGNTTNYIGQNPCDPENEWNLFRNYYLVEKDILYQQLFTIYKNNLGASYTCTNLPADAESWFPDPLKDFDADFPVTGTNTPASALYTTVINPPANLGSASPSVIATYTNALSQFTTLAAPSATDEALECETACASYTAMWDITLKAACPAYNSGTTTPVVRASILSAMAKVCELGCDYRTSMLGASSASPGLSYTLPSSGGYTVTNFQQILDYYLYTNACDAVILDEPAPYPVSNGTLNINALTSCKCDIILQAAHDYTGQTTYEWEYFEQLYGFDLPDYYKLKCICQAAAGNTWTPGHTWTSPELTSISNYTQMVSPELTCSQCLNCSDITSVLDGLTLPVSSTLSLLVDRIRTESGNQIYALNTLNKQFGVHTLNTYLDLYQDCSSFTLTTPSTFGNCITQQGTDLFNYLNSLAQNKFLAPSYQRQMTFCTDEKFYLSTLYNGSLPGIPGYTYFPTVSGNSLHILIAGATQTIANITLEKPSGHTGSWNDLKEFYNFKARCSTPHTAGPTYEFQIQAIDVNFTTIIITGTITNAVYPIAYLSAGNTSTLNMPSLCPQPPLPVKNACVVNLINNALGQAQAQYTNYIAAVTATFQAAYKDYCFSNLNETFTRTYRGGDEYNYTLYYYDQAGNLQRTVPPNGSDPGILSSVTTAIAPTTTLLPAYSGTAAVNLNFASDYYYNSYNQVVKETSVDGGLSEYYYDAAGRLMASQNAKQKAISTNTTAYFSYSLYDKTGRITETGEVAIPYSTASVVSQPDYLLFESAVSAVNTRSQVTRIYYDRASSTPSVLSAFSGSAQANLRNRVAFVLYMDHYSSAVTDYDHATYYSYDDHGNVTELVQHTKQLDAFKQGFRNIKYEFELISGNMLKAIYQDKKPDQFIHRYYYDEDNRLKEVFTSKDKVNWDRDAKYFYYEHGPLARIERGDQKIQGTDYFYTIHGWIKGVNSEALSRTSDAGKDGTDGNTYLGSYNNIHKWVAGDAMGFGLNYYNTSATADYKAIKTFTTGDLNPLMALTSFTNSADSFYLDNNSAILSGDGPDLFNGNISSMTTSFIDKDPANTITNNTPFPQLTAYRYDQLQRISKMKSFRSYSASTLTWNPGSSSNYDAAYRMTLSYDNNGNILSLFRNGSGTNIVSGSNLAMDNLDYSYFNSSVYTQSLSSNIPLQYNSNKLRCLTDAVPSVNYSTDIDTYTCTPYDGGVTATGGGTLVFTGQWRYGYDPIGNLIYDRGEHIDNIEWTLDRKVRSIQRSVSSMLSAGVTLPDIEYAYNSQRQRVMKLVKPRDPSTKLLKPESDWLYTYYVYDVSGNVLATYNRTASQVSGNTYKDQLSLQEQPVYGSSRLAMAVPANTFATWSYTFNASCSSGINCRNTPTAQPTADHTLAASGYTTERNLGYKDFELSNHLGNVITTVSDRKIPYTFGHGNCVKEFDFQSGIPSNNDINPNSILLSISGGSLVCTTTTNNFISGINPNFGTNLSSSIVYQIEFDFDPGNMTSMDGLYLIPYDLDEVNNLIYNGALFWGYGSVPAAGHYSYTYTPVYTGSNFSTRIAFNALGSMGSGHYFKVDNVKMCSTMGVVASYSADITSNTDYYPFGQEMPGRTYRGGDKYRYSMNGQENEDEVFNGAKSAEFWMYDSRIGRRWEIDPKSKPWKSPFSCFSNSPIWRIDPKGDDDYFNADGSFSHSTKQGSKIHIIDSQGNDRLFADYPTTELKDKIIIDKVIQHYSRPLGISRAGVGYLNDHLSSGVPGYYSPKDGIVYVNYHGGINPQLNDFHVLKSLIRHERTHKNTKLGNEASEHVFVYLLEFENKDYQKPTTPEQYDHVRSSVYQVREYLNEIIDYQGDLVNQVVNDFNKIKDKTYFEFSIGQQQVTSSSGQMIWKPMVKIHELDAPSKLRSKFDGPKTNYQKRSNDSYTNQPKTK